MIWAKQVHFIEQHWEAIGRRALTTIHKELPNSKAYPDPAMLDRVQELIGHLGDWLSAPDKARLGERYEHLGRMRALENIPLYDLVRGLQIVRQSAADYVRESEIPESSIAIQAESDLEYRIGNFFDLVICHLVRGYETALRGISKPATPPRAL